MKILIIDRDRLTMQLLVPKLESDGHNVITEPVRNDAIERVKHEQFDMIMMDSSPLPSPRPMVLAIKKAIFPNFSYLMLLSHHGAIDEIVNMGLNDYIEKPVNIEEFYTKIENAANIVNFDRKLRDDTIDIRTDGVVFGKKPFFHLFHSAMDRAARYGEQAFLLFFRMDNYLEFKKNHGADAVGTEFSNFANYIARLRRQSDFLAQVDHHELVLIMQRPSSGTEPIDAGERFFLALKEYQFERENQNINIELSIHLIELPMGNTLMKREVLRNV